MRWATALALQSSDFFTISLTHLFHGREPLHKWRRACNTGADGRRCRLHTRHRNPKKPSVCKKTTFRNYDAYTHDARNTRRTTHALHSPARLGANLSQKSHGCIGRGPAATAAPPGGRASRKAPASPPNPLALAQPWAPQAQTLGHPAQKMFGSVETLSEQRRDAEGAVECPEPTGQRSSRAAGSRVVQCRPLCRWNLALAPARRAAPRWRPRGGINVVN